MNEIQELSYSCEDGRRTKPVRIIDRDDGDWWVAKDICDILGITYSKDAASRLDDDERDTVELDTLGGSQQTTIISESGLYSLILTSRKPEARRFRRWVTHDVLPSIRRTGRYEQPEPVASMVEKPRRPINPRLPSWVSGADADPMLARFDAARSAHGDVLVWENRVRAQAADLEDSRRKLEEAHGRRFGILADLRRELGDAGYIAADDPTGARPEPAMNGEPSSC